MIARDSQLQQQRPKKKRRKLTGWDELVEAMERAGGYQDRMIVNDPREGRERRRQK
jgi:hypothetical protein